MQTFIGTKIVQAQPMSRGEYNAYRGWTPPDGEDQAVDGYLVEYLDGGAANDSRHTGYISWSPKPQFDAAYIDMGDVSGLLPHQQRVVVEKAELDARLGKLTAFLGTEVFASIDAAEQERLHSQAAAMTDYSSVLTDRIAAFSA